MASIQVRKDRKKPYRVFWSDTLTGKPRNKSFVRRKEAQAFMESIRASENTLAQADPNKTVADALDRWYSLCTTTGRGGREPVERSTSRKYDSPPGYHQGVHRDGEDCRVESTGVRSIPRYTALGIFSAVRQEDFHVVQVRAYPGEG